MTFYIPLKRKFDASQYLTKDLGLKIYGTESMTSCSDIIVSIFRKLSPLKHQFERKFDSNDFLAKDWGGKKTAKPKSSRLAVTLEYDVRVQCVKRGSRNSSKYHA